MVCCAWFPEVVVYARAHPESDLGVHLTLTSERMHDRWGPTAPRSAVPSLVDRLDYFHQTWTSDTRINPNEVEIEPARAAEEWPRFYGTPSRICL